MANGRTVLWVRRRYVGLNVAIAVVWLAFAATQVIPIVNGDSGTNGGHIFGLVLGVLIAVLAAIGAVVAFTSKRRRSMKRPSQRVEH
ncbi:hypothetical protein [Glaciibacter sp. 2TAF33]|uniref:hypothetical protein n=1 Tax=Glaciibacter sp. 2TAF33 TaxID=3233015 RepID=UPI003F906405